MNTAVNADCLFDSYIRQFRSSKLAYWLENGFPDEIRLQLTLSGIDYESFFESHLAKAKVPECKTQTKPKVKPATELRLKLLIIYKISLIDLDVESVCDGAKHQLFQETLDCHTNSYNLDGIIALNQGCYEYFEFNSNARTFYSLISDTMSDSQFLESLTILKYAAECAAENSILITNVVLEIAQYVEEITNSGLYLNLHMANIKHDTNSFSKVLAADMYEKTKFERVQSHHLIELPTDGRLNYFAHHHFIHLCNCLLRRTNREGKAIKNLINARRYKVLKESSWLIPLLFDSSTLLGSTLMGDVENIKYVLTKRKPYRKSKQEINDQLFELISIF